MKPEEVTSLDRWFNRVRPRFGRILKRFRGKPIVYVEVGCWGGASAEWVARNILTHPHAIGIGIDPYAIDDVKPGHPVEEIKAIAAKRLEFMGDRWLWVYDRSQEVLRDWEEVIWDSGLYLSHQEFTIDALYLDGSHWAQDVVQDFALAWPYLKVGSVVIFDDYRVRRRKGFPHVAEAYHAIMDCWGPMLRELQPPLRQAAVEVVAKTVPESVIQAVKESKELRGKR